MAFDRTRSLRGALAGSLAAAVWLAQQPLDKRAFGIDYDDAELLGRLVARGRPGEAAIGAFLVPLDTPGLNRVAAADSLGVRGLGCVDLDLTDVRVGADALLGGPRDGFQIAMWALDGGRVAIAAQALGVGQAALDAALAHAKQHEQFGQPIGNYQAIQWMLADMHVQLEAARLLVYRAAARAGHGFADKVEAAVAKVHASETAITVTNAAMQIHGAAGYSCDLPLERMARDARMFTIGGGTAQMQRNLIGRSVLEAAEDAGPAGSSDGD